MTKNPCILSIVTVCYRALPLLEKTLRNIARIKCSGVEYIVVDGGSDDGSAELLRQSGNIVDRFISQADDGIYDAMNKGRSMARGSWIIFMNAGDVFTDEIPLEKILLQLTEDREVVYGDILKLNAAGQLYRKKALAPGNYHKMFFCHQAAFTRRDLLDRFPFDTSLHLSADFKFFKQAYLFGSKFVYLPLPIAVFDTSGASNKHRAKGLAENIAVIRAIDSPIEQIRLLPRLYFTYYASLLRRR